MGLLIWFLNNALNGYFKRGFQMCILKIGFKKGILTGDFKWDFIWDFKWGILMGF